MTDEQTKFDREAFVQNYVDAAINEDAAALEELPKQVEELSAETRIAVIEEIVEKLEQHEGQAELVNILKETIGMIRLYDDIARDSSGEASEETSNEADAVEAADPAAGEAEQESSVESVGTDSAEEAEESQTQQ